MMHVLLLYISTSLQCFKRGEFMPTKAWKSC